MISLVQRIAQDFASGLLLVFILLGWEWWRVWRGSRRVDPAAAITHDVKPSYDSQLRQKGDAIDDALWTYSRLLDNECHEEVLLEIARERIERLRREFEDLELHKLESVTKG